MDSRMRQSLDNYITGGRYTRYPEEVVCNECGHRWEVIACEEYGMRWYEPDDEVICPKCGTIKED